MLSSTIVRSRTGTYHRGFAGANIAFCNGRSMNVSFPTTADIDQAHPNSFCKKCFKEGKPLNTK